MNVTINFHCHHCERGGFVKILGGNPPTTTTMICPACGGELANMKVGYEDSTIYLSRVGDSTNWDYDEEE